MGFQEDHARDCQEILELRRICCKETEQPRKPRSEELSMQQQQRNLTTVSQLMVQIRELQNRVNSLSEMREFYDPESESSSGATHVPDQNSTILSPRTMPRCDSGLPRSAQNCSGTSGNVFERPLVQEGRSSTVFNNSKHSASTSQELRPDTTETARREWNEKRAVDSVNPPTTFPKWRWYCEACEVRNTTDSYEEDRLRT